MECLSASHAVRSTASPIACFVILSVPRQWQGFACPHKREPATQHSDSDAFSELRAEHGLQIRSPKLLHINIRILFYLYGNHCASVAQSVRNSA